jgi:hypothetical protein
MAETKNDSVNQPQSFALKQWQFYLLTGISAAALGLVFITTSLSANIGAMRAQIDERQQFINETLLLSELNVQLAQVLANLSIATNDNELKQVLQDNGISFSSDAAAGFNRATVGGAYGAGEAGR